MSHVADGILHALLDGALAAADPAEAERVELHVAACPDCRARLDEAVRLRDASGALLASAQPRVIATPPFETIRARAGAMAAAGESGATTTRRMRRAALLTSPFKGLAWAATVVFAVGLGWLLRDTVQQPERVGVNEMAEPAESMQDAAAPQTEQTVELSATPAVTSAEPGATTGRASQPVQSEASRAPTLEYSAADRDGAQQAAPPPPPPPAPAAQRLDARAEYDVAEEAVVGGAANGVVAEDMVAAPPPAAPASSSDGWRATTPAAAERLAGELIRLEDAELVSAATRTIGSAVEVRTVQVTGRGETVSVVQRRGSTNPERAERRAAAVAAESAAAENAQPVVTVQVDEWTVTISGPVDRARLEELADGLR